MLATFLGINVLSYILKDAILLFGVNYENKDNPNILEVLMLNLRKRLTSQACNLDSFGMEILSKPVVVPFGDYLSLITLIRHLFIFQWNFQYLYGIKPPLRISL